MKIALLGVCASFLLLPSSQEVGASREQKLAFGVSPVWVSGEKPALLEIQGPATIVGPVSSSLFMGSGEDARETYMALPLDRAPSTAAKAALPGRWKLLVLPPRNGDLQPRELRFCGVGLEIKQEAVKMESSCGACGHQGPAILTQTPLGTVYLPVKLEPGETKTPPPSKVRFQ